MSLQAAALYALVSVAGADKSVRDLRRVSGQVNATQGVMSGLGRNAAQMGRGVGQVAGGLFRVAQVATVALAGAGVAAAKTSNDFEDAFAQVEKTVEDTPEALAKIEQGLEQLSTQIPVTFHDLTTIASEAGALGVKTKDIEKFTEAVARTSAATVGLDPFMASEAFGKLSTIFTLTGDHIDKVTGQVESDYDRLGSALVALGNAGASSEAEIIDITKYFAQAGQQAGLSAAQVLAWGSALTSLGMQPEAGGGALQRVFQRITTYLGTSNKKADEWARLAGMSTKKFKQAFDEDASGAIIRFLGGLKELDQFQGAAALKKAGIVNQRDVRAILALSNHIPVLTYQLGISTNAWDENTALMEVSEKRFDTLKSKLKEFHNTVLVGADAVGDGMTPAIGRLIEKAKEFLNLHMGDLENLGKDIGQAIDDIDWGKVNQGLSTAVDLGKMLLTFIAAIPVEITAGVAAFSVLNRVSGGLLGAGAGNIIGGAIGMVGTLARGALLQALPPALRGPLGAATALHVWVDNMPGSGFMGGPMGSAAGGGLFGALGGGGSALSRLLRIGGGVGLLLGGSELIGAGANMGGIGGGVAAGAGGLGMIAGGAAIGGPIGAILGAFAGVVQTQQAVSAESSEHGRAVNATMQQWLAQSPSRGALENGLAAVEQGISDIRSNPLNVLIQGDALAELESMRAAIDAALVTPTPSSDALQNTGQNQMQPTPGTLGSTFAMPPAPGVLEATFQRALEAGFHPKGGIMGAANLATYERNIIRAQERQEAATDRVKEEAARTTAAVNAGTMALHSLRESQAMTALIQITVPPARAFQQVINETRHYGPSTTNVPRHARGTGPLE